MKTFPSIKNIANRIIYLPKNLLLICLSYGFTGINFILSGIISNETYSKILILFGIIMLCMVPISYIDKRKEMQGKFYAIACCLMHFLLSLLVSVFLLWWVILLYIGEIIITFSIFIFQKRRKLKSYIPKG